MPRTNRQEDLVVTISAGGVVLNKDGRVLVVRQRGDTWSLPKGHAEEGENLVETARREIHEESGVIHLSYVSDLGQYKRLKTAPSRYGNRAELKTIYMFLFYTEQVRLAPSDPDNPDARWIPKEQVANLLSYPEDRQFFIGVFAQIQCARQH